MAGLTLLFVIACGGKAVELGEEGSGGTGGSGSTGGNWGTGGSTGGDWGTGGSTGGNWGTGGGWGTGGAAGYGGTGWGGSSWGGYGGTSWGGSSWGGYGGTSWGGSSWGGYGGTGWGGGHAGTGWGGDNWGGFGGTGVAGAGGAPWDPFALLQWYRSGIVGNWYGTMTSEWNEPAEVWITFQADGHYTAKSADPRVSAFYWGDDGASPSRTYALKDIEASRLARGWLAVVWNTSHSVQRGDLDDVQLSADQNKLEFLFWNTWSGARIGPLKFTLERF